MDLNLLKMFEACSANNDRNKHLWLKGASLIINQYINLIKKIDPNYFPVTITDMCAFINDNSSELAKVFINNRTDKSSGHNYHHLYSYILNEFNNKKINILEIGMGTNNPELVSTMGYNARPGASLYSFREYYTNANIYGADIDKNILFNDERINTCYVDQLDEKSFNNIKQTFGNIEYDLIIDDGLHSIGANFNTLLFALDNIKVNGWIVIEDIGIINNWFTINYILSKNENFKTYIIKAGIMLSILC